MDAKKPILPYEYLKGHDFVEKLKDVLNCSSHQELAERLHVPKSTFSTWSKHERTSHELMVRLHLALGIPIEELALKDHSAVEYTYDLPPAAGLITIQSYSLENGSLEFNCLTPYTQNRFDRLGLHIANLVEIQDTTDIYLVDRRLNDAVSGKYLIEVDGRHSINQIQRLPGKKLAIEFGNKAVEVEEENIKVVGRVVVTLRKE